MYTTININKYLSAPTEDDIIRRLKNTDIKHVSLYNLERILLLSAKKGYFEAAKKSLEGYQKIRKLTLEGALRTAAIYGHSDIINYLLKFDINVNTWEDQALRFAAYFGYIDVVKTLVENGANIYARRNEALRRAKEYGHTEVVEYLENKMNK